MSHQAQPVSHAALTRLELRTGSSNKLFIPNQNAKQLSFSLQRQQTSAISHDVLMLVIHNDKKPLISIRLTDVLRNPSIASNVVSTDMSSSTICVKIPSPDCMLLAHFQNARDFHVCVYVLETAGFTISSSDLRSCSFNIVDPVLRTNSNSIAPMRLSSVMAFPSMSQPELLPQNQSSGPVSLAAPDSFNSYSIRRTESVPPANSSNSFLPPATSQIPIDLNPYNHFATDKASMVSALHDQYSRNISPWGLHDAKNSNTNSSWGFAQGTVSEKQHLTPGPRLTTCSSNTTPRSSFAVEQLDAEALSKASDFRHLMPQARNLPFPQTKQKSREASTGTAKNKKRKAAADPESETDFEKSARTSPPSKRQRENRKPTAAQTAGKGQAPESSRSTRQSASRRNVENGKEATVAKSIAQKKSTALQAAKPATKKIPPKTTVRGKQNSKVLPAREVSASECSTRPRQVKKEVPKPAKAQKQLDSMKMNKTAPTSATVRAETRKTSQAEKNGNSAAKGSGQHTHSHSQGRWRHLTGKKENLDSDLILSNDLSGLVQADTNWTLLITETAVLDELNEVTSKIVDQYGADLAYGYNRFEIAQFYVEVLNKARFEYWHDQLAKLGTAAPPPVRVLTS